MSFVAEQKPLIARSSILPRDRAAAPLDLVICVMAFLAALALGGVLIAQRTAAGWERGLVGRLTVQVLPEGAAASDEEVQRAVSALRATPGIVSAAVLNDEQNAALLEPWLGADPAVADLPFPRLIDVQLAPDADLDVSALANRLRTVAPHSVVDDHGRWLGRLRAVANTFMLSALAILFLIAVATSATVAFATRAGLAAHREIVELLHLMGAQDRFIARAFEWHYFTGALVAAATGSLIAAAGFLAAGGLDEFGYGGVSYLPPLGLSLGEVPWLVIVPAAAALIAWGTTRLSVISALRKFY
jgi:cell division transport system permease protein